MPFLHQSSTTVMGALRPAPPAVWVAASESRGGDATRAATGHGESRCLRAGFTLIELLVVLAIIGALTTLALPALKNVRKANIMVSAGRQLVDDFALARARAISDRTTVHVVFVPSEILGWTFPPGADPPAAQATKLGQRLTSGPYTTYALFAERTVGDQPGRPQMRYLTSWRTLPDGVFIATNKFRNNPALFAVPDDLSRTFEFVDDVPFPTVYGATRQLPHVAFDAQGRLVDKNNQVRFQNEVIPLARGSILYTRGGAGVIDFDVREAPPNNSVDNFHRVIIDGLTGRGRVETPQIQ